MNYLIERLQEPSTWRGIMAAATGMGIVITPEYAEAIIAAGLGLMGLIGVATKDK